MGPIVVYNIWREKGRFSFPSLSHFVGHGTCIIREFFKSIQICKIAIKDILYITNLANLITHQAAVCILVQKHGRTDTSDSRWVIL